MKNHKVDICIYSIYLSIYLSYVSIKKCIGLYEQWIETDQTIGPDIPDRPRLYGLTLCTLCIASILPHALEWLYIHFCNILNTCNTPPLNPADPVLSPGISSTSTPTVPHSMTTWLYTDCLLRLPISASHLPSRLHLPPSLSLSLSLCVCIFLFFCLYGVLLVIFLFSILGEMEPQPTCG